MKWLIFVFSILMASISFAAPCTSRVECTLAGDEAKKNGNLEKANSYYQVGCKLGSEASCNALKVVDGKPKCLSTSNGTVAACLEEAKKLRKSNKMAEALEIQTYLCDDEEAVGCFEKAVTLFKMGDEREARDEYKKSCSLGYKDACTVASTLIAEKDAADAKKSREERAAIEDARHEQAEAREANRRLVEGMNKAFQQPKKSTTQCRTIDGVLQCDTTEGK